MKINLVNNSSLNFNAKRIHCEACKVQAKACETENTPKRSKFIVPALIAATSLSILGTMTLLSKGKMGTGKIANFLKNSKIGNETLSQVEGFNMFKKGTYKNLVKSMKYGPLDVFAMASASVVSGLTVGSVLDDKKNTKTKLKESVSQIVGNILFPIVCVTGASVLMDKTVGKKLFDKVITPESVRKLKLVPSILAFGLGVAGGNKTANKINQTVFKMKDVPTRGVKIADFSGHIDDGCTTVGLVGKGVKTCEAIARVIPAALTISGISTGLAKEEASLLKEEVSSSEEE